MKANLPKTMATVAETYILLVTIVVIVLNTCVMPGMVATSGLHVLPMWVESNDDINSCSVITTEDGTLFTGSTSDTCNLWVEALQEDLILVEKLRTVNSVEPSFLYVKRFGEMEEC